MPKGDGLTKTCYKCGNTKPVSEFHKNKTKCDGLADACKQCVKSYNKQYVEANKIKLIPQWAEYRDKNKDRAKEYISRYQKENKEKISEIGKRYRANNKEKEAARRKLYAKNNRGKVNAITTAYRVAKNRALPLWADKGKISAIYEEAARLTRLTGVVHHVDHIIPLQGKLVTGLHCELNLQILTGVENQSKGNRYLCEAR